MLIMSLFILLSGLLQNFMNLLLQMMNFINEIHSSIGHIPFKVCLGYQPLAPIDVSIPVMQSNLVPCLDKEKDRAIKFIDKIHHLQQQVHEILEKTNKKYK